MNPFTPRVAAVVRREFILRVKSKWFLLSTLGLPVLIVGLGGLAGFLAVRSATDAGEERRVIGVADPAGLIGDFLVEELLADSLDAVRAADMEALSVDEARSRLSGSSYDLLLMIPRSEGRRSAEMPGATPDADEGEGDDDRTTLLARASVPSVIESSVRGSLQRASVRARLRSVGVQSIDPGALLQRTSFDVINVTESGEARSQDIYRALSFGIAFFFYFILLIYGQMIVRAILEEKQSDIVEIMVSSLRPWELMLGKIVGVGAVGIAQMAVWALVFALAAVYGLTAGASTLAEAGIDIASIPIPWGTLVLMFFFLVFGYLLYAGMFAGAGATISNEHDAQQVMLPITMLIILPFIATQGVIQSPNAGWGVILSLVPFFSPLVMPARLFATSVPVWQWLASLVLLGVFVLGAAWVAGRIFRVGILMKGQRANLPQVLRWIRHG
ncbi:ABC transporter permease [Candidatus Palauibacter polyketidifaciens]|uniref:ABC transporter permease n=1 Tax=Candidatus Palauibacter polyketidifaciens TaxID=3056740 RepID=UPI002399C95F|nr:ABC transporter permease [Candidatus Palauibacter polyketidifaciens]MDE2720257.1 ABC transporter permease [Candidatus Palauibacter polyketidifaciens]